MSRLISRRDALKQLGLAAGACAALPAARQAAAAFAQGVVDRVPVLFGRARDSLATIGLGPPSGLPAIVVRPLTVPKLWFVLPAVNPPTLVTFNVTPLAR